MVIVVVLPLTQLLVEQVHIVGDAVLVEELIELLVIDTVRPLDLAIEMRRPGPNVDMADVLRFQMPVKARLEFGAVVGLNHVDAKWESPQDVGNEADRTGLCARIEDLEHANAR